GVDGLATAAAALAVADAEAAAAFLSIDEDVVPADEWVQCDHAHCNKWRRLAPGMDLDSVDKWYCEMNTWDPARATCSAPEEIDEQVVGSRVGTVGRTDSVAEAAAPSGSRTLRGSSKRPRASSGAELGGGRSIDGGASGGEGGSRATGGKGRGKAKKVEQQWVCCDHCEKWRKLGPGVEKDSLPEKWYCSMNTWGPYSSCEFEEEADLEVDPFPAPLLLRPAGGGGGG
ncbi:unnamed protein product, partial [Choristocarpus tenellus]